MSTYPNHEPDRPPATGVATPYPPVPPPPPQVSPGGTRSGYSPFAAVALALIPFGVGHLYLGLYERAVLLAGSFWLAVVVEAPPLAVFLYFFMVIDAWRQTQLLNSGLVEERRPKVRARQGSIALGVFLLVAGTILLVDNLVGIDLYWLRDWWPALMVLLGLYFIAAALVESRRAAAEKRARELPVD